MADTTLTWLGHSAFRLDTAGGKRIYVDPFLNGNPRCPPSEQTPERVDVIAVTHGHGDHVGDTVAIADSVSSAMQSALYDPQTSGGLLISIAPAAAEEFLRAIGNARIIGRVSEKGSRLINVS